MRTKMALWVALVGCLLLALPVGGLAWQGQKDNQTLSEMNQQDQSRQDEQMTAREMAPDLEIEKATVAVKKFMGEKNNIPPEIIQKAEAVAIFPGVTKAGLLVGGQYGKGILMVQQDGKWNGPLFLKIYGASIGAQVGVESTDLVMVFMEKKGLRNLEDGKLDFGAEASVTAGHLGEKVETAGAVDILGYSDTAGLFAGVSLSSGYIEVDNDANFAYMRALPSQTRAYYPTIQDLMAGKGEAQSSQARQLADVLTNYAEPARQGTMP